MTKYYNPQRTRNVYDPADGRPFAVSRSKLDLFLECPRCFHLDRRLGVGRPPGFPFNLNTAVDDLWLDAQRRFVVVDYKATSKAEPITALDQGWHAGYKRQMEIYQWLLRHTRSPAARNATRFPRHAGRFFPCHADDP